MIQEYDSDKDGLLDFGDFLTVFAREKESGKESELGSGLRKHQELKTVAGARGERSYDQEEVTGYSEFLNQNLAEDPDVKHVVPITTTDDTLFKAVHDGILLCKLCKLASPDCIDERVIATGKKLNTFSLLANCTLAVQSAKSIGVQTTNIGPNDIRDGTPHLVLGLTWQLVRLALMKDIQLTEHPELFRLLKEGETIADLLKLSPEQILLRWLNYHLGKAGSNRVATNFTKDLSDSEILTIVLDQVAPECNKSPLNSTDYWQRAELMLREADKIGCRKFVQPKEIVRGHPRLNLAFVANLFNTRPGLEPLDEAEKAALDDALFRAGGTRTERQFCLWMNSYGVDPFVMDLYDGLQDGTVLLQMLDKVEPGCVDWGKASKGKLNKFKAVQNQDLALEVAKKLGLSIVGISGANIYASADPESNETDRERDKKFVLAVLWKLLRYDYVKGLKKLGGGAKIKDEQIVAWANEHTASKSVSITGFKDPIISSARPILELIGVLKPDIIDWAIFEDDPEKYKRNAMYVLTLVRTLGATIYALPEDIVDVNPQMVMTVYASLMGL
jgi:hypothetical protein